MNPEAMAAVQAMKQGRWQDAKALWHVCLGRNPLLTAADYNACARVYERLADWEEHHCVVHQGLVLFPEDPALQRRDLLCRAMMFIARNELDMAWELLGQALKRPVSYDWPCAVKYQRWKIKLEKRLLGVDDRCKRLSVISEIALYRASHLLPQRIAGIVQVIECMTWPASMKTAFIREVKPLIAALASYDIALDYIEDAGLAASVDDFARFWRENLKRLSDLPAGYCEFFARLFIGYGYFDLYLHLRTLFVEKIPFLSHPNIILAAAYQLAHANECGDFERFTRLKDLINKSLNREEGRGKREEGSLESYCALSMLYYYPDDYLAGFSEQDQDFYRYVTGKSVAIVGPVDVGLESGVEIEGFDIVVRFNHRHGIGYESRKFGKRTDVSWYVRPMLETESPVQGILEGMAELKYAVTSKDSWGYCRWLDSIPCRRRESLHCWTYLGNPMMIGYPHAVQRTLLDLLRFRPARVKIFASDLYTGMAYRKEYMRDLSLGEKGGSALSFFSLHDPISNFLFMKYIARAGRIEADEVLSRVLKLTVSEYLEQVRVCHSHMPA